MVKLSVVRQIYFNIVRLRKCETDHASKIWYYKEQVMKIAVNQQAEILPTFWALNWHF